MFWERGLKFCTRAPHVIGLAPPCFNPGHVAASALSSTPSNEQGDNGGYHDDNTDRYM